MRAAHADIEGFVTRDGVNLGFEVFGGGDRTILLMPTWTIVHSRVWKMQVAYLARHYRVITYDGPGNGRSDTAPDPSRYAADEYAGDALAVLDATGTDSAVVVGLSLGAAYATRLARIAPDRVEAIVMIGPSIALTPPSPERDLTFRSFTEPYPENVSGWGKYNLSYWRDHYEDFAQFFFEQCFIEPHSTKPIEDAIGWARGAGAEVLAAEAGKPEPDETWPVAVAALTCPVLVIHGTHDRISSYERGVETARLSGGSLLTMEGSGHIPNAREPVAVNRAIRSFVEAVPT